MKSKLIYSLITLLIIILIFYIINQILIIKENYNSHTKKKYYVSVCCIIKDETYLEEFIIYNRVLGVEHFYIYDNESNIPIKHRLKDNYFKEICTIIDFPGKVQQLNAYNDCLKQYGQDNEWLIFIDGDEFILPKKHNNITDFLSEHDEAQAIGINWVLFGSSFHDKKQTGLLIDKYRYSEGIQNKHVKTICKPEYTIKFEDPHTVVVKDKNKYMDPNKNIISPPFNENNTIDIIQINHYYGKSIEEQHEKMNRGTPDRKKEISGYVPQNHDKYNNIKDDLLANKYLQQVYDIYNKINI